MSGNKGNYVSHPIDLKYTTWKKKLKFPMTSCPYCVHKYYLVRRRVLNRAFELSKFDMNNVTSFHKTAYDFRVCFNVCFFQSLLVPSALILTIVGHRRHHVMWNHHKKCLPKGNCITMKVKNKRCTLVKHVSDVRMNENTSCFCFVCFFSLIEEENSTNERWDSKVRGLWAYRYPMTDTITATL